jgi:hypothetical protein
MGQLPLVSSPAVYRIRIAGKAANGWDDFMSEWTDHLSAIGGEPVTVLTGRVTDQAALFGMLCRLRDLGLVLISAECLTALEQG